VVFQANFVADIKKISFFGLECKFLDDVVAIGVLVGTIDDSIEPSPRPFT